MEQDIDTLGIIAGNRSLPMAFAEQARAQGVKRLVAVAFENETDPALAQKVDEIVWLKVGQLSRMLAALKERGVAQCVMLGQIAPRNLFEVRPDFRALALLVKLKEKNAHSIFGALAEELKKEGIELIEPVRWLRAAHARRGFFPRTQALRGAAGGRGVWVSHGEGNFPPGDRANGGGQGRGRAGGRGVRGHRQVFAAGRRIIERRRGGGGQSGEGKT